MVKEWKFSPWDQEQDRDVHSHHFYLALYEGSNLGFKVN